MSATEQIAEVLLAGDTRAMAAARSLAEDAAWPEALALATRWKVIPQLLARLQRLNFKLNDDDTKTLRQSYLRASAQSLTRANQSIAAIQALEQAGIAVVAFKGLASMALLYGGPRQRTIGDGDLLVARKDLPAALACLEAKGFTRKGEETLAEYLHFVENAPRFAGNQAITLYADDGSEIDLHWEIAGSGLRADAMLQRAVPAALLGATIPVVDARDGLLLTVHHAIREDLGIESVCRDLLDARLWCEHLERTGHLEAGMKAAAQAGSAVAALAIASLLQSYDETSAAARAAALLSGLATPAQRRSAAHLTEVFHFQMGVWARTSSCWCMRGRGARSSAAWAGTGAATGAACRPSRRNCTRSSRFGRGSRDSRDPSPVCAASGWRGSWHA